MPAASNGRAKYAPSTETRVPKSAGRRTPDATVARHVASTMLSIGIGAVGATAS